ncbi:MAG: LemA family protein [Nitrososphaerota archaeon]|nr:LemA family protein [Nitrososphaerota archaeon]
MERVNIKYLLLITLVFLIIIYWTLLFFGASLDMLILSTGIVLMVGAIPLKNLYKRVDDAVFKIDRLPLLDVNEATEGVPFCGEGIIISDYTIRAPYSQEECVYYHYIKEKLIQTIDRIEWQIQNNEADWVPFFYLKDRRGNKIRIELKGVAQDFSGYAPPKKFKTNDMRLSELEPEHVIRNKRIETKGILGLGSEIYRINEYILRPNTKVFAVGMVYKDGENLYISEHKDWPLIISRKSKQEYVEEFKKGENLLLFSHFIMAVGYSLFVYGLDLSIGTGLLFWPLLILGNGVILGTIAFTVYNRMIELEQRCSNALSTVEVELKRRADLIPQLVNVVKKYKEYEKEVQTLLAEMRTHVVLSSAADQGELNKVSSLIASLENYPKLKASEQFMKLMTELTDTEERIAQTREFYNRTALRYNNMISQFPTNLLAIATGKKKREYLNFSNA